MTLCGFRPRAWEEQHFCSLEGYVQSVSLNEATGLAKVPGGKEGITQPPQGWHWESHLLGLWTELSCLRSRSSSIRGTCSIQNPETAMAILCSGKLSPAEAPVLLSQTYETRVLGQKVEAQLCLRPRAGLYFPV